MDVVAISSLLITQKFFLSGINKIKDYNSVVEGFHKKIKYSPKQLCMVIIILVILLEVFAPIFITFFRNQSIVFSKILCWFLIIFTVLATILYHLPATGDNFYHVTSNVALVGGLLLLANSI